MVYNAVNFHLWEFVATAGFFPGHLRALSVWSPWGGAPYTFKFASGKGFVPYQVELYRACGSLGHTALTLSNTLFKVGCCLTVYLDPVCTLAVCALALL